MELEQNMEWLMKWFPDENHAKGFELAKKTPHSKSTSYHSGGGFTHLFLHLIDGRVMAIHFMDFEVETSEKTFDTIENYLDKCFNTY
jgi:hypothetical protein